MELEGTQSETAMADSQLSANPDLRNAAVPKPLGKTGMSFKDRMKQKQRQEESDSGSESESEVGQSGASDSDDTGGKIVPSAASASLRKSPARNSISYWVEVTVFHLGQATDIRRISEAPAVGIVS